MISDIKASLDQKAEYYLRPFRESKERRNFNKSAAIFQMYWMAYRKMLLESAVVWVFQRLFISIIIILMFWYSPRIFFTMPYLIKFGITLYWCIQFVLIGYLGNRLYWSRIKRGMKRHGCKDRGEGENLELYEMLKKENGVSVLSVIAAIIIFYFAGKIWVQGLTACLMWILH